MLTTGHVNPNDCISYELMFLTLFMQYGYQSILLSFKGICVNQKDLGKCNSKLFFYIVVYGENSSLN